MKPVKDKLSYFLEKQNYNFPLGAVVCLKQLYFFQKKKVKPDGTFYNSRNGIIKCIIDFIIWKPLFLL